MSIILVLIGHVAATPGAPAWMDKVAITSLGNVGVRVFFLISGFLITTLMLREQERTGHLDLKGFYIRRALRILPAAYFYIGVIWVVYLCGFIELRYHLTSRTMAESALPDLLHAVTFTANYQHDYNWYYNHLWSLSVEEQFYLIWPLLLLLLGTRRAATLAFICILAGPFIRTWMATYGEGPEIRLNREFQAVADALALGSLMAILHVRAGQHQWFRTLTGPLAPLLSMGLVLAGYGVAFIDRQMAYTWGQSFANIGILILLQHAIRHPHAPLGRVLNQRWAIWLGGLSYSLYLWQEPFLDFRGTHWVTAFPQNLVMAFGAAWLSQRFIEQPFLRIKDRLSAPA
jgi:peptidoglycan/LPS O-acetylase OafA/YrhL